VGKKKSLTMGVWVKNKMFSPLRRGDIAWLKEGASAKKVKALPSAYKKKN